LYWTAQPGLVAHPLWSGNLVDWAPVTNALGAPLNLTTRYGTIQWLEIEAPPAFTAGGYFRLQ
jgi:hypothetical protein